MENVNQRRRQLLITTSALGATGLGFGAVPFVASMLPSERAKTLGGPVDADLGALKPGEMLTAEWRGKPVWVVQRTPDILAQLPRNTSFLADPASEVEYQQPAYARNEYRSIKPEWLVLIGLCTHLGCVPARHFEPGGASGLGADWPGGWFCPCHGSKFDLAGRVYKNVPAPTNLVVPPHHYAGDARIVIGVDPAKASVG